MYLNSIMICYMKHEQILFNEYSWHFLFLNDRSQTLRNTFLQLSYSENITYKK